MAVDIVVLQVSEVDVSLDNWVTELLNSLAFAGVRTNRRVIEGSVNRMIGFGLLAATVGDRPRPTAEGQRVLGRLRRFHSTARAREWLSQEVESRRTLRSPAWRLSPPTWTRAKEASAQHQRARLLARKEIVDGLLDAMERLDPINEAVRRSRDVVEARERITKLGYTEIQAQHILDTPIRRQTETGLAELRAERARLESLIAEVDGR